MDESNILHMQTLSDTMYDLICIQKLNMLFEPNIAQTTDLHTHKLTETLDSQLVHYTTTKCVLYMQLLQIKIVRQKVAVTH